MKKTVLVIGNGFDIDLGLPTSFTDFAQSKDWYNLTNHEEFSLREKEIKDSLIGKLHQASNNRYWFDIEEEIYKYTCIDYNFTEGSIKIIKSEFEKLKNALKSYLYQTVSEATITENAISKVLLHELIENKLVPEIINFNYTSPLKLIGEPEDPKNYHITYVHGSLDEDIVLGCDTMSNQINEQLSFLYKYNMLNKANHIAQNMMEAEDVYIFGHSINKMDFCYFFDYFKIASSSVTPQRKLTIFTKDYNSEINIKNNIKSQGISVIDLYNHLQSFDFFHTKGIYNKGEGDCNKWANLLYHIRH